MLVSGNIFSINLRISDFSHTVIKTAGPPVNYDAANLLPEFIFY